ncbi:MAG: hypothetical protein UCV58_15260 [Clostridium saudiense]|uniref:hypothetical protein n=1 Tax=Clostridium sp. CAG:265 TaxID=1262787 RepID=UPI0003391E37|nr:hypothetical protein [Clostridium sp. CAG:265]MEE0727874.1 hypothetical protein [Clostridium saudiense]CDB74146.1 transposase [Clostridium sp. CAG:265]
MGRKNDINFDYNSEVKKCKTIDNVLGKNGLVQRLNSMIKKIKKIFIQNKYKNLNKYSKCKNVIKSKSEIKQVKSIL